MRASIAAESWCIKKQKGKIIMDQKEKMALIEEALDTEEGALTPDTVLADIDEWDSIAALSLIAMLDEQFDKTITGAEIKAMRTVADILAHMN